MKQYLEALRYVLANGEERKDRTGIGTKSVFGYQMRFDLGEGFPALTTKKIHMKSVICELLWFLRGETNIRSLQAAGVTIWDEFVLNDNEKGDLGPIYGKQWRDFGGVDQIKGIVEQINNNPMSRRILVSAWNPPDVPKAALPPCHVMFQFYVHNDNKLDCHFMTRSTDLFLGAPFNIASYALLTHMVAYVCDKIPGTLTATFGDLHIYANHIEQVNLQLTRETRQLSSLRINSLAQKDINKFKMDDFSLENYNPHPAIKAPVAI